MIQFAVAFAAGAVAAYLLDPKAGPQRRAEVGDNLARFFGQAPPQARQAWQQAETSARQAADTARQAASAVYETAREQAANPETREKLTHAINQAAEAAREAFEAVKQPAAATAATAQEQWQRATTRPDESDMPAAVAGPANSYDGQQKNYSSTVDMSKDYDNR